MQKSPSDKLMLTQLQRLIYIKFICCLSYRGNYGYKIERTNLRYRGLLSPTNRGNSVPKCLDLSMSYNCGGFLSRSHLPSFTVSAYKSTYFLSYTFVLINETCLTVVSIYPYTCPISSICKLQFTLLSVNCYSYYY